jgi:hypothetical protein
MPNHLQKAVAIKHTIFMLNYIGVGILVCGSNRISPLRSSDAFTPAGFCSGNLRNKRVGEVAVASRQTQTQLKLHCKLRWLQHTFLPDSLQQYNTSLPDTSNSVITM